MWGPVTFGPVPAALRQSCAASPSWKESHMPNKVKFLRLPGALCQLGAIRFLILWPEPFLEAAASGIGF